MALGVTPRAKQLLAFELHGCLVQPRGATLINRAATFPRYHPSSLRRHRSDHSTLGERRNKLLCNLVSLSVLREDPVMNKVALAALACLTLGACATPTQTVGTLGGVATGAAVGGPVGAVVGGAVGAVVTRPGSVLGGHHYRCRYHDRYGHVHYRC